MFSKYMCIKLRKSKKKNLKKSAIYLRTILSMINQLKKKDVRVKPNQTFGKNPKSFQISNYLNEMVSADSLWFTKRTTVCKMTFYTSLEVMLCLVVLMYVSVLQTGKKMLKTYLIKFNFILIVLKYNNYKNMDNNMQTK